MVTVRGAWTERAWAQVGLVLDFLGWIEALIQTHTVSKNL